MQAYRSIYRLKAADAFLFDYLQAVRSRGTNTVLN